MGKDYDPSGKVKIQKYDAVHKVNIQVKRFKVASAVTEKVKYE